MALLGDDTIIGHERDLESDLQSAILSVRQEDDELAIDESSEYLLSEDQINRYLIGLQDEWTRASFYCTATRSIAYKPAASESPSKLVDTVTGIVDRAQLRDWIVSQEWSWIHPRYRWLPESE